MDFSLLKSFIAVAEEQSFSAAAGHLFVSQQSLSKQIAKLESELGTVLFIRSRPLALTPDGKLFLQVSKEIIHLEQQFEENSSKGIRSSNIIHIGIAHTTGHAVLPRVLPRFYAQHPDSFVKFFEEAPETLQKSVAYDGIDLVIGSITNLLPTYKAIPLCKKEQVLVVPKQMLMEFAGSDYDELRERFAAGADITKIAELPFIRMTPAFSAGRILTAYLKHFGVNPTFSCEIGNIDNAFQLVCGGLGVLIYSKLFWDTLKPEIQAVYLKSVDVFPLPYLPEIDCVCAYYHKDRSLHGETLELLNTFIQFFKDYENGKLWPA